MTQLEINVPGHLGAAVVESMSGLLPEFRCAISDLDVLDDLCDSRRMRDFGVGLLAGAVPMVLVLAGFGFQFGGPLALLMGRRVVALFGPDVIRICYWLWLTLLGAVPVLAWVIGVIAAVATIWNGGVALGVGMLIPLVLTLASLPWLLASYFFMWLADPTPDA